MVSLTNKPIFILTALTALAAAAPQRGNRGGAGRGNWNNPQPWQRPTSTSVVAVGATASSPPINPSPNEPGETPSSTLQQASPIQSSGAEPTQQNPPANGPNTNPAAQPSQGSNGNSVEPPNGQPTPGGNPSQTNGGTSPSGTGTNAPVGTGSNGSKCSSDASGCRPGMLAIPMSLVHQAITDWS